MAHVKRLGTVASSAQRRPASGRWIVAALLGTASPVFAAWQFPTANHALLAPGLSDHFFVGTVGKPWISGTFGCVRTGGWQLHEGLDIRALERDRRGEPTDPILAAADGTVAYVNLRAALSAYGIYVILQHTVDGVEVYSLYAHLSRVSPGLRAGQGVKAGQPIGVMGRTANTAQSISLDRAHLHFEVGLLISERYSEWHRKTYPRGVNDHGLWNGLNFAGLDPEAILLGPQRLGPQFNLLNFVRCQTELCRVLVRGPAFPWVRRYGMLVQRNRVAEREGVAGYEIALNFNGVPFHLVPRAASEMPGRLPVQLLSVNEAEYRLRPCRKIVMRKGNRWELGSTGRNLISVLTF